MSSDHAATEVFSVLDDEYSRAILEATRRGPKSGKELSEECEMSRATVSRRVNDLLDRGFIVERTHVDPEGHHYSEYEAVLDRVDVTLDANTGFDVRVEVEEDAADRFARIWKEMRND
ncbi:ArsR/SmtB family transcription factor [Halomicroarcula sp. GCM10025324]|uniref:ArsR/SmtB family transcription factor n=1 Tax=Haloarcula TaxID=2237 RepID=UPI0023E809D3|nr:winged helix-turn-helix domain-containing protein [Halomicroarcula sp. ZS-22-S1]